MERRLVAILAADVAGYSKLMAEDEAGTLDALREPRRTLFDTELPKRGGRLVKLMPVKINGEITTVSITQNGPIAFIESTTMMKILRRSNLLSQWPPAISLPKNIPIPAAISTNRLNRIALPTA